VRSATKPRSSSSIDQWHSAVIETPNRVVVQGLGAARKLAFSSNVWSRKPEAGYVVEAFVTAGSGSPASTA
jgi:hypothetical protein